MNVLFGHLYTAVSLHIDAQKVASYYHQNMMLQFYICYHKNYYAIWMLLEKLCHMKININFRDLAWNRPPAKCWSKTLFYPLNIIPKFLSKILATLRHPKNVKSSNNTTVSHLVSCRVIPRPATMKEWEKEVLWKIRALGNLKCNQNNIT